MKCILPSIVTRMTLVCLAILGLVSIASVKGETISFQTNAISVSQTAGTVSIPVECVGDIGSVNDQAAYQTQNGTAVAGTDYTAVSASVSFNEPGVQYISVPVTYTGSTVDRTFSVILTQAYFADLGAITSVTVTIKAEPVRPPVVFTLGKATYTVSQGAGAIRIPVSFTNSTVFSNVWVKYATKGNTATSGTDYSGTDSTKVKFATGANTAVITIPIHKTGATKNRTFNVILLSSSEGSLGTHSLATVTILKVKPVPRVNILTTAGPAGVPFTIYGSVSNVKKSEIKSVQFKINGQAFKIKGTQNWKSTKVIANSPGRYKMVVTVFLKNGKKLSKSNYLSIT